MNRAGVGPAEFELVWQEYPKRGQVPIRKICIQSPECPTTEGVLRRHA
ncbi:hypothetical protein KCP77_12685 [Salmonella enterica subsp. enterica]|nr:hypothetical protein KCP77_12685 [Salmonella enterica subsp. enterica]